MVMGDPCELTAAELSAAYRLGALSPLEAVDALLARIARLDPILHAFVEVLPEDARLAAAAAGMALRSGHDLGPLHGVPVVLKDLIALDGRSLTAGSRGRLEERATGTATLARKLIGAGAIMLGKTHTVEYAFGGWGTNLHLGTPRNPWRPETPFTPGGSSSGSGVAVAARMAPLAVGTDTGGSIRIPASFNGITGLKVTRGRISNQGIVPLSPTLDTPGPMTRSVEDAALMYEVMHGPDPLDTLSLGLPSDEPMRELRRGVTGLRLGRVSVAQCGGWLDRETEAAYEAALETLQRLGAVILDIGLPLPLTDYAAMTMILAGEAYALYADLAEDPASSLNPHTRARLMTGRISARDYLTLQWRRQEMAVAFQEALAPVAALLTPTTLYPARPVAEVDEAGSPSELTRFVNLLGCCALAIPNGVDGAGLPLSLQVVGRPLDEAMLLRIGYAFQDATDWHRRQPKLVGM
jgi:aspartyl-tRNA(Asn)/glutamyl-tRNA(Gln) amidotransferase subunit A